MNCGNVKEWIRRNADPARRFFSHGIGGLKPHLVHVEAPPRYTSGHQISFEQELDLATKVQAK
jgi:hypothetical protein